MVELVVELVLELIPFIIGLVPLFKDSPKEGHWERVSTMAAWSSGLASRQLMQSEVTRPIKTK